MILTPGCFLLLSYIITPCGAIWATIFLLNILNISKLKSFFNSIEYYFFVFLYYNMVYEKYSILKKSGSNYPCLPYLPVCLVNNYTKMYRILVFELNLNSWQFVARALWVLYISHLFLSLWGNFNGKLNFAFGKVTKHTKQRDLLESTKSFIITKQSKAYHTIHEMDGSFIRAG